MKRMEGVIVIGAGLAGLGCARFLPGSRVFESAKYHGGHCYSHEIEGVFFDEGAHICHSQDQAWLDLICANAPDVVKIPQSRVANFWRGLWMTYPVQNHLHELPLEVKTTALQDFVLAQINRKAQEPSNYLEWCLSQYGEFLTNRFYKEYTAKYWRVPMEELATDWLSGRLLPSQVQRIIAGALASQEEKQSTFSKFHYPARRGFYNFVRPLSEGVNIVYDSRLAMIEPHKRVAHFQEGRREHYEALASSIPLPELVQMVTDAPREILESAQKLRHTQLLCVNLIIDRPDLTPHHWFYIYDPEIEVARASIPSNLAPCSVPDGQTALQAEVFRRSDESCDVDTIVKNVVQRLSGLLNFDPSTELIACVPVHVPYAYVISDHERARAVRNISEWLAQHSIFTMGMLGHWMFMWSDAAFRSGEATAQRIWRHLHEQ